MKKKKYAQPEELKGDHIGYRENANIKEYIKLRFPEGRDCFGEPFSNVFTFLKQITWTLFLHLAKYPNPNPNAKRKYLMDIQDVVTIKEFTELMSSVSLINYYKIDDTDEIHYPSSAHQDTGLLTLVVCSGVAGLQIYDKQTDTWMAMESNFEPRNYVFVFMGEKISLFSGCEQFVATTHRVVIKKSQCRMSMVFLLDVGK